MAKELPYFKFFVSEWSDGDITLEDMEVQGLFINLCAYYWSNECNLTLTKAKKRFRGVSELGFEILIENNIISVKNDVLKISFLNEQRKDRGAKTLINRENGAKGGRPKKNPMGLIPLTETVTEPKAKQKALREEEKREEEKRIDKNKEVVFSDWLQYRKEIKKPIKSESTLKGLIEQFNKASLKECEFVVSNSISNQWTGLFWDKYTGKKESTKKPWEVNVL